MTPECVQVWKSVWFWFASEMLITTGVEMGRRRLRRAEPRSQASSVVKCSNTREESMREIDSSCCDSIVSLFSYTRQKWGLENSRLEAEAVQASETLETFYHSFLQFVPFLPSRKRPIISFLPQ